MQTWTKMKKDWQKKIENMGKKMLTVPHHLGRDFSTHVQDSLHVLKTAAQFTPIGAQLFNNMSLEAEEALV